MGLLQFSANIADQEAPPPLPAGEYPAICVGATEKESKSSGNPRLELVLKISREDFPADFDPGEGVDDVTLSVNNLVVRDIPADRFRLRKYCEAFGVAMSNSIDSNDFVGRPCMVKVRMGKDLEGNPRPEIERVTAP